MQFDGLDEIDRTLLDELFDVINAKEHYCQRELLIEEILIVIEGARNA